MRHGAGWIDHHRVSAHLHAVAHTGRIAAHDPHLVLHGTSPDEQVPRLDADLRPASGNQHRGRAGIDKGPEQFRKTQVVTGSQAGPSQRCVHHNDVLAGGEHDGLAGIEPEQVDLAVGRQHLARRTEDDRGVVEVVAVTFQERACVQHAPRREVGHVRKPGVQRNREVQILPDSKWPDFPQFREQDEFGVGCGHELPDLVAPLLRRHVVAQLQLDGRDGGHCARLPSSVRCQRVVISPTIKATTTTRYSWPIKASDVARSCPRSVTGDGSP